MLLVALSCLQGRPMRGAFDELAALADGVQLTPGNHPTAGFRAHVAAAATAVRTHHGFDFERRAAAVWSSDGALGVAADSVHPPEAHELDAARFQAAIEALAAPPVLEGMYPGYRLGDGAELAWAMGRGLPLAVDVSHLHLQRAAGVLDDATLARRLDYDRVVEVHLSANDGRRDLHFPIDENTYGLDWARARLRAGTPVVLECYLHRLDGDARRRQVALARGE